LSAAYALVFNKTPSWARPNNYTWVLRDDSSGANSEIFVYKGYYAGWLQTDVVKRVLANASKCYKDAAVFAPAVYSTPWTFNFKMNCWNWRFLIDAKISDFARGSSSNNRGASLASRFADVCPP
jgi:hypothetical protein